MMKMNQMLMMNHWIDIVVLVAVVEIADNMKTDWHTIFVDKSMDCLDAEMKNNQNHIKKKQCCMIQLLNMVCMDVD